METLIGHSWPGNVRELINVLERAVLLAQGDHIEVADLPEALVGGRERLAGRDVGSIEISHPSPPSLAQKPLREARREVVVAFERDYLADLMKDNQGRIGTAARQAGVNSRSLYGLLRRHRIRKEDFKL
jgi:DNA-binding NtrC family response regulator